MGVDLVTRSIAVVVLFLLASLPAALAAEADVPATQAETPQASAKATVQTFYDGLLATMKDGPTLGFSGRAAKIKPLVEKTYSLEFMIRLIVGAKWASISDADKAMVLAAFSDWVVANYASQFTSFDGEKFVTGEVTDGGKGTLVVQTQIVPSDGKPVSLGYRMLNGKVIDVYLEGSVSQLALWRSQFASVIGKDGINGLVERLKSQTKKLAAS
jgi:phospholipid transport system substrate-binding protein